MASTAVPFVEDGGSASDANLAASASAAPAVNKALIRRADFLFGATLGEGSFARVVHARLKPVVQGIETAQDDYAMKIMDKQHIIKEDKVQYVKLEIKMLGSLSHPFVVK